ncbi:MAG: hypothetical protein CL816_05845 [Coxiellaceae bacterium]|nr:hypothetical protein [Coxiellaceae bacterium]
MIAVTSNFFRGSLVMMVFLMFSPLVMSSSCNVSFQNCCSSCTQCLVPHTKGNTACENDDCVEVSAGCGNTNCYFCVTRTSYDTGDKHMWEACTCSNTDCNKDSNPDCSLQKLEKSKSEEIREKLKSEKN